MRTKFPRKSQYLQVLRKIDRFLLRQLILAFLIIFNNSNISAFNPMAQFTIQFAQVILDPKINVHSIRQKDNLFILEGVSESKIAVYHLAEDILNSGKLSSLKLVDAISTFEENNFTLFIQSEKLKEKKSLITISSPDIKKAIKSPFILSGKCGHSGKTILISGDVVGSTQCRKGKWKLNTNFKKTRRSNIFVKALLLGKQGHHGIAIRSFSRQKRPTK